MATISKKTTRACSAAALLTATFLATTSPGWAETMKLEFGTLTGIGMAEQDVFVAGDNGTVHRIAAADVEGMMDAPLFGATELPPFEPLNLTPTESYGRGMDLGLTLGEWLGATAEGSYSCENGMASIDIQFGGLVPDAVYTMWNFIDAEPPTEPWQTIMFPLGARDGSEAMFKTDANGHAAYSASFEPCLEMTGTQTLTGLAAAWHADGKTYGASPGDLGIVSFAQLMAALIK